MIAALMATWCYAYRGLCRRKMSVRLSVCHTPVLCQNGWTYPHTFSQSGSHAIVVYLIPNVIAIFDGEPLMVVECKGVWKNRDFRPIWSRFISEMIYGYYGMRIGNRIQTFDWYHFCRAMLCKRGLCRHAVRICLCVRHVRIIPSKRITVSSKLFIVG